MDIPMLTAGEPIARKNNRWVVWVIVVTLVLGLAQITTTHLLYQALIIPSMSMSPTLCSGDRVIATRDNYQAHEPRRFDLVVFRAPALALSLLGQQDDASHPTLYIKRVIGLPGDHIKIVANKGVYVNGKLLPEPYVQEQSNYDFPYRRNGDLATYDVPVRAQLRQCVDDQQAMLVPPGKYFVLGDNRIMSHDSHIWGLLPRAYLRGKVFERYWPPDRWGFITDKR